ncbi:MAG: T9SS type A sorting domain-containing protein [Bacteroidetes bacterium]|nr:T9SS type A sorting domain-containing protein [Bacteroidota bacterium]
MVAGYSGIKLRWNTSSESENDYFEIWKSSEAENFTLIGKVNGSGTTTAPIDYEFIDASPLPGLNYYQLRQVDYNGTPELSNIVVVLNRSNSISCTLVPVITGKYTLVCAGLSTTNYSILDMNGRRLSDGSTSADGYAGIDLSFLPQGSYLLVVLYANEKKVFRLLN